MNRLIKNKFGGGKVFSIWWFAVFVVVLIGLVTGTMIFYSAKINIKSFEAEILYSQVMDCVSHQGFLKEEVFQENFFSYCSLNKKILESSNFYLELNILELPDKKLKKKIVFGEKPLREICLIEAEKPGSFPECFINNETFLSEEFSLNKIKYYQINTIVASNQEGNKYSLENK